MTPFSRAIRWTFTAPRTSSGLPPPSPSRGEGRVCAPVAHDASTATIITDGKIGDLVQCRGVAEAMGLAPREVVVAPRAPWRWLAPRGSGDPKERARLLTPPHPDIAIASGRRAIPYFARSSRLRSGRTFTICLKDPRAGLGVADFIWVPEHDPLRGPNVLVTLTSPHGLSANRMAGERASLPIDIAALPRPRVTVLLGGPSGRNRFSNDNIARLCDVLIALGEDACSFLVTPSRRTPPAFAKAVADALGHVDRPVRVWDGTGDNPYVPWMAAADALVVTGDSVNMVGEAAAMGRPVLVHRPDALSPKIVRFLDAMEAQGAIVPLTGSVPDRPFAPLDATPHIAAEALRRFRLHRKSLSER